MRLTRERGVSATGQRAGRPRPRSRRAQPQRSIQDAARAGKRPNAQSHGKNGALYGHAPADSVRLHETVPRPRPCSAARSFLRTQIPARLRAAAARGLPAHERPRHHEVPRLHRRRRSRRHDHGDGRARARAHVPQGRVHGDAPGGVPHFTQKPLWSKGMTRDSSSRSGGSIPSGGFLFSRDGRRAGTPASSRNSSRRSPRPSSTSSARSGAGAGCLRIRRRRAAPYSGRGRVVDGANT